MVILTILQNGKGHKIMSILKNHDVYYVFSVGLERGSWGFIDLIHTISLFLDRCSRQQQRGQR